MYFKKMFASTHMFSASPYNIIATAGFYVLYLSVVGAMFGTWCINVKKKVTANDNVERRVSRWLGGRKIERKVCFHFIVVWLGRMTTSADFQSAPRAAAAASLMPVKRDGSYFCITDRNRRTSTCTRQVFVRVTRTSACGIRGVLFLERTGQKEKQIPKQTTFDVDGIVNGSFYWRRQHRFVRLSLTAEDSNSRSGNWLGSQRVDYLPSTVGLSTSLLPLLFKVTTKQRTRRTRQITSLNGLPRAKCRSRGSIQLRW